LCTFHREFPAATATDTVSKDSSAHTFCVASTGLLLRCGSTGAPGVMIRMRVGTAATCNFLYNTIPYFPLSFDSHLQATKYEVVEEACTQKYMDSILGAVTASPKCGNKVCVLFHMVFHVHWFCTYKSPGRPTSTLDRESMSS